MTMPTTLASSIRPQPTQPQSGSHHEPDRRRSGRSSSQSPVAIDRFHVRRVTLADPELTLPVLRLVAAQRWKPVILDERVVQRTQRSRSHVLAPVSSGCSEAVGSAPPCWTAWTASSRFPLRWKTTGARSLFCLVATSRSVGLCSRRGCSNSPHRRPLDRCCPHRSTDSRLMVQKSPASVSRMWISTNRR